jgi:probable rRNA maturation factor
LTDYEIDILIEEPQWSSELHSLEELASQAIDAAMTQILQAGRNAASFSEISLAFVNDEKVRDLNKHFRQKDKPTNVLSFPGTEIDGFKPLLGDVVLAFETIRQEATDQRKSMSAHTTHMLVHGFLHLQGFDHQNDKDASDMETLEIRILQGLGISNPYVKEDRL